MAWWNHEVLVELYRLRADVQRTEQAIWRLEFFTLRVPGQFRVAVKEDGMGLRFKVCLPKLPIDLLDDTATIEDERRAQFQTDEISHGILKVSIAGAITEITTSKIQQRGDDDRERCVDHPNFLGEEGDAVELSFAYVDDANNVSVNPAVGSFSLSDVVPPVDPASVSLMVIAEEAPPEPEPEPEE